MKTKIILSLILTAAIYTASFAQVKVDVESKVNREANQRANSKTDEIIDKSFDKLEEAIGNLFKKKDKKNKDSQSQKEQDQQDNPVEQKSEQSTEAEQKTTQPNVQWSKFDFVPGDEVIFEDGPSADEESGEFPSHWDLVKGQVEIAKVDGENVTMFVDGNPMIVPFLKSASEDYLPEVFTIEFDFYRPAKGNRISVYLYDYKNLEFNL